MPLNINLLSDDTIARGITPPDIGNFATALTGTQDYLQKQALQNLFAGGLPRDPATGLPNWDKAAEMLVRSGGAAQLPAAIGLMNLQAQRNLPSISSLGQPQEREQFPPSVQRTLPTMPSRETSSTTTDEASGDFKPPGQNLGEITGVQRGPIETTPFPERPPSGSAAAAPAPQFTPAPTSGPVSGPPTDRFQVAQATPPRQTTQAPMPGIPTQPQGKYTEAEALRQETIRDRAQDAANAAGNLGNKVMAETYQARANQAAAYAKDIRENLMKGQVKQTEVQVEQEKGVLDEAKKNYATAQSGGYRLGLIDKSIKDLGPNWTGAGADARAGAARAYNSVVSLLPVDQETRNSLQINPAKVATWEDFNKQSLNLGFELARTLGAREAMQIVQQATASVPNANQSYWGARLVASAMRQSFQRQEDYYNFVIGERRNGRSLLDADERFNAQNPVQKYVAKATSVVPPQRAIQFLQANPTPQNKQAFDKKYGDGATIGVFGTQ